jgi:hypothetical protein
LKENSIVSLVFLAFLVETIWEIVKRVIPAKIKIPDWLDVVGSMTVGLLLAFGAKADLVALLGFQLSIPYLGIIITGLAMSRGSNFMHDLFGSVSQIYQNKKNPPMADEDNTETISNKQPIDTTGLTPRPNYENFNPTAQESAHNIEI